MSWEGLNPPYSTIVADPPWPQPSGGPRSDGPAVGRQWNPGRPGRLSYSVMSIEAISQLPILALADARAHLYLWTTNHFLDRSFDIVRGWGFTPSQVLTWCKPPQGLGLGGAFTNTTEFILFGWRGSLSSSNREDSSWWHWSRTAHSVKPPAFYDIVERVSPGPYVELFARQPRLGWDHWGLGHES